MGSMHAAFDKKWHGVSLRAKITGVTVLLLTFGLTVAGVGTMNVLRNYLVGQTDTQISALFDEVRTKCAEIALDDLSNCISAPTSQQNPYLLAFLDDDGDVIRTSLPSERRDETPDTTRVDYSKDSAFTEAVTLKSRDRAVDWRVKLYPVTLASQSGSTTPGVMLIGLKQTSEETIGNFALIFFGFALAVVVLGAAITQLLVTSTFAPLRDVERTAARFAAGDYSQRLGGATPNTEVGRLNRSLNTMLARIDRAFSDRAKSVEQMRRFVGDASHELRTPLVSLRGYAELYRMGALQKPEDVAQAMDRIEREAIRMGALVQDLLELARLDEARTPELAPLDLLPIAQDAALDASASNPNRVITVVVPREDFSSGEPSGAAGQDAETPTGDAADDSSAPSAPGAPVPTTTAPVATAGRAGFAGATWARLRGRRRPRASSASGGEVLPTAALARLPKVGPVVLADENKIRQVVTNLIGNATRFTPSDSPIELEVDVDHEAGYGAISIVDHGEGIPPQLREKIFQRFWRADTSRTRDTGGSGLGLAIVAGIVANHNGLVEVFETPGGGATFRVSLPLLPPEPEPENSTDAATTGPESSTAS